MLTLSGSNNCTGKIVVSAGQLALGEGGDLGNAAISVARAATFAANPGGGAVSAGTTGPGLAGATLTLPMGSLLDVSSVGAFKLQQEKSFLGPALTLSGGTLVFALSSAASARSDITGGRRHVRHEYHRHPAAGREPDDGHLHPDYGCKRAGRHVQVRQWHGEPGPHGRRRFLRADVGQLGHGGDGYHVHSVERDAEAFAADGIAYNATALVLGGILLLLAVIGELSGWR